MISNVEVLRKMNIQLSVLYNSIVKQKMAFAGRSIRGLAVTMLYKYWKANWMARLLKGDLDVCGSMTSKTGPT